MVKNTPEIKIIVGPTSSGKTAYAVSECKRVGGEIVSFDSRQLFKHMDVGTGKIPVTSSVSFEQHYDYWLIDNIKVWGYDLALPDQYFSAYDYALYAKKKIDELIKAEIPVFLVGGTGFYLDVLTGKIALDSTEPDMQLRSELNQLSLADALTKLKQVDIQKFNSLDKNNPRRVLRALENALIKQKNITKDYFESPLNTLPYEILGFVAKNETLYRRADMWLETVWQKGLLIETTYLLKQYPNSYGLRGLIYKQAVEFINGNLPETTAKEQAKFGIHAYIRRQLTWFRKNSDVKWIEIED